MRHRWVFDAVSAPDARAAALSLSTPMAVLGAATMTRRSATQARRCTAPRRTARCCDAPDVRR
eukprot:1202709-Pyramimonas_sp.AAC.1